MNRILLLAFLVFGVTISISAQQNNLEKVKSRIIELSTKEINAFKSGDCQTFIDLIADNATFYLNGKKAPNKEMIFGFCNRIRRPFEKPSNVATEYIPVSNNSAYLIRTMEFSKDEKVYKKEVVTKIWVKGSNGWKIAHLHSTIKEL